MSACECYRLSVGQDGGNMPVIWDFGKPVYFSETGSCERRAIAIR
jgi:hypothetical protein